MCPSYRATRDERDTTRGRANALRIALETAPESLTQGLQSTDGGGRTTTHSPSANTPLAQRWLHEVMDLCLSCKACKSECPANVDVAKLKAEFLQA
jgi:Fe-S oxidoreductase